jgi:sigma-B regulation protein RsbU (phosphoserine phosphatase)
MDDDGAEHLQCMEVWGGSRSVDRAVEMGGLDAWVYSKPFSNLPGTGDGPRELAGGDVYYASSCATGRIHRLLLADVAGHGDAVADTADQLRGLMRQYVNRLDQKDFVRSMNQQFGIVSADGCFATAVVTTFFAPNRMLSVCNAGHPSPLLFRAAAQEWSILEEMVDQREDVHNIPLGILEVTDYEQFDIELEAGDLVLCYTDALIESYDKTGEFLGEQGLLELVKSLAQVEPRQLIDLLLGKIAGLDPRNLQSDDVTVLLLRPNPKQVTIWEKLGAVPRALKELVSNLRPGGRLPLPEFSLANVGGAIFPALSRRWRGSEKIKVAKK